MTGYDGAEVTAAPQNDFRGRTNDRVVGSEKTKRQALMCATYVMA